MLDRLQTTGDVYAISPQLLVTGKDYWTPTRTGNWATDTQIGRDYADTVANCLATDPTRTHRLPWMVQAMAAKGEFSGVEAGFFQRVAEIMAVAYQG